MIRQVLVERPVVRVDEGIQGFHDYVNKKEDINTFCAKVEKLANEVTGKVINIAYPSEDLAIIVYKERKKNEDNT